MIVYTRFRWHTVSSTWVTKDFSRSYCHSLRLRCLATTDVVHEQYHVLQQCSNTIKVQDLPSIINLLPQPITSIVSIWLSYLVLSITPSPKIQLLAFKIYPKIEQLHLQFLFNKTQPSTIQFFSTYFLFLINHSPI